MNRIFICKSCREYHPNLGGLGKETANWIAHGSPSVDMFGYDIKRFAPDLVVNDRWLREKCHETMVRI